MDVRNTLDGLKSLLGTNAVAPPPPPAQSRSGAATVQSDTLGDRATLSSAANEVSQAASGEGIRMDKVLSVQQALAAGTYNVPASAVASKVVDSMMAGNS
jgi:flagellar biosynthesis anti-sigma factor FlgM